VNALDIPTLRQHLEAQTPPHQTRAERISEYVAAHPGAKATQIAEALNMPRANVSSQLAEMVRSGTIYRCGLRCDYMHYADAASCQAAKDEAVR
jgi:transcriptional regulator with AAA-type ATPase domain